MPASNLLMKVPSVRTEVGEYAYGSAPDEEFADPQAPRANRPAHRATRTANTPPCGSHRASIPWHRSGMRPDRSGRARPERSSSLIDGCVDPLSTGNQPSFPRSAPREGDSRQPCRQFRKVGCSKVPLTIGAGFNPNHLSRIVGDRAKVGGGAKMFRSERPRVGRSRPNCLLR
jgi:hypothetical protein